MIQSGQNENFKRWKELLTSRGIKKHGQFLLFGAKVVHETLEQNPEYALELIEPPEHDATEVTTQNLPKQLRGFALSKPLFDEIDVFGTNAPILVAKLPQLAEWNPNTEVRSLELLCPVGDPSNLGALLRSALGFGLSRVVLLKECAHPFHPKCVRALSTNPFALELLNGPSIRDVAAKPPEGTLALDMSGHDLTGFSWPKNARLLLGEEGPGLPSDSARLKRLRIPTTNKIESLNVTVAGALAMFSYRTKHPLS
ncbi:MAG TPA: RNA methyltransferase [Bdellovibrionales bacterium]|nr:RNA methyltransferase [Bdellovibrionales bacterium]